MRRGRAKFAVGAGAARPQSLEALRRRCVLRRRHGGLRPARRPGARCPGRGCRRPRSAPGTASGAARPRPGVANEPPPALHSFPRLRLLSRAPPAAPATSEVSARPVPGWGLRADRSCPRSGLAPRRPGPAQPRAVTRASCGPPRLRRGAGPVRPGSGRSSSCGRLAGSSERAVRPRCAGLRASATILCEGMPPSPSLRPPRPDPPLLPAEPPPPAFPWAASSRAGGLGVGKRTWWRVGTGAFPVPPGGLKDALTSSLTCILWIRYCIASLLKYRSLQFCSGSWLPIVQFFEACALGNPVGEALDCLAQGSGLHLLQMKYLTGFSASGSWCECLMWSRFSINHDHFLFCDILSKPQIKRS